MENILLKSKRADMHTTEMIFMLIGLTVFFVIVLLFYLTYSISNVKAHVTAGSKAGSILLAEGLAGSPEFACPDDLAKDAGLCVDSDKILAMVSSHPLYAKFWSNDISGLRIEKVGSNTTINCASGNYEKCNTLVIIPNKPGTEIDEYGSYVTLCKRNSKGDKIYSDCALAEIIVAAEKRAAL